MQQWLFPWSRVEEADGSDKGICSTFESRQRENSDLAASAYMAEPALSSVRRARSSPPPMSFCVTLSIKEGGRFVLKETEDRPPLQSCFRVERTNGRLRLCLVEGEEVPEEDACRDSYNLVLAAKHLDEKTQDQCMASYGKNTCNRLDQGDLVGDVKYICKRSARNELAARNELIAVDVEKASCNDMSGVLGASMPVDINTQVVGIECSTLRNNELENMEARNRGTGVEEACIVAMGIPPLACLYLDKIMLCALVFVMLWQQDPILL
ncbi:hypothetical protein L7F22_015662 [Adiantum nelumboides]|nr:hypothetical protein [Adiantum nelumboides]